MKELSFLEFSNLIDSIESITITEHRTIHISFNKYLVEEDVSARELYRDVDKKTKQRQKIIKYEIDDISKDGIVTFKTTSGTYQDGKFHYIQHLKFDEWEDYIDQEGTLLDRIRIILHSGVEVDCDCNSFRYNGYSYITTELGTKFGEPEKIFPSIRNPDLTGSLCKHLSRIIVDLSIIAPKIVQYIKKNNTHDIRITKNE